MNRHPSLSSEGRMLLNGFRRDYLAYLVEVAEPSVAPVCYGIIGKYVYVISERPYVSTKMVVLAFSSRHFDRKARFDLIPFEGTLLEKAIEENPMIIKHIFPNTPWVSFGMIMHRYGSYRIDDILKLVPPYVREDCLGASPSIIWCTDISRCCDIIREQIESERFFVNREYKS